MKPDWMCVLTDETGCSKKELFLYNHRKATKQSLKHILGSQGVHEPFSTMMAARREIIAHSVSRMSLWYLFAGCHAETALCLYFKFVKWHLLHKQLNIPRCHFLQGIAMCLCSYCGMFLFNLCLIAVNTIKWNLCGSHQPEGWEQEFSCPTGHSVCKSHHWATAPPHTSHLHPDLYMNTWVSSVVAPKLWVFPSTTSWSFFHFIW